MRAPVRTTAERAEAEAVTDFCLRALTAAGLLLVLNGCAQMWPYAGLSTDWRALLDDVRAYERAIGFRPTRNFTRYSRAQSAYPYCGRASPMVLPYSYQDPAVEWLQVQTEAQCRALGEDMDFLYGLSEAVGERGSPVAPAMVTGGIDRFIYLIIHEDCHDQFDFPYGIEEPLCDVIAFKAMAAFVSSRYGDHAPEAVQVRRYIEAQTERAYATIATYGRLEDLYARYERGRISSTELLRQRMFIYKEAHHALRGEPNNVLLANLITYSRHLPLLERVYKELGDDMPSAVRFLRRVDEMKPASAVVMRVNSLSSQTGAQFLRANEQAVLETMRKALAEETAKRKLD